MSFPEEIYDESYRHIYAVYTKAIDAEGERRCRYLRQALSILENIPDDYKRAKELKERIRGMMDGSPQSV